MAPRAMRAIAVPAADPMMIHFLATRCTMRTLARTPRRPAMAMMMGAARDTSKADSFPLEVASPSELLLFVVAIIRGHPMYDTDITSALGEGLAKMRICIYKERSHEFDKTDNQCLKYSGVWL